MPQRHRPAPPFDPLEEAAQLLDEVLEFRQPSDHLLSGYFRSHPKLGRQDRARIAETIYGVLRHLLTLRWLLPRASARLLILLWQLRFEGLSLTRLGERISPREREWLTQAMALSLEDAPLHVRAELPEWVWDALAAELDAPARLALGRALQKSAPLDLRVNSVKASRDAVIAELAAAGIEAAPTPHSPLGLRLAGHPDLGKLPAFSEGRVEVQDEGSQLICQLVGARRGEMIADLCAGAGGKTLALGAAMASSGRLYAFDIAEKRLQKLGPRLARSGLSNVTPQLIAHENDTRLKRLAGKLDRVLIDAPCSGLGTLRRNPDLKFRQSAAGVIELCAKQASLIRAGARLLRPGGRLVYATCSLLPAENRQIVDHFLAEHPQFSRLPPVGLAPDLLTPEGDLSLRPDSHGSDGFYGAVLESQR
jgi:16S rRNA (cytosine967-C5)-methyltransferase